MVLVIGAQKDKVGTAVFQSDRGVFHPFRQFVPITLMLERFDLAKVNRPQQTASRMNSADPMTNFATS
jgi:hypothetical protein